MDELRYFALCVVITPLLSAIIIGILNKRLPRELTHWLACLLMATSFIASLYILIGFITGRYELWDQTIYLWGQSGSLEIPVGFLLDRLTALVITVVTFVSLTVHVYSIGYMHDDPGYQRFFCYISLFTFSMLMLVMSNNFAQLFFGWEAVGLLSYLLIGFWYHKSTATFAGLKAFLVNRVGDIGFIIGIAAIWHYFDTLQFATVFTQVPTLVAQQQTGAVTFICICLFIGAMAKSAQVPLHVWLPDSMEGPTPISALIHAATMVTAGVFMVARMSPLFEYSTTALNLLVIIGSITCLSMGILGVIEKDIKRIIAYSTLSQLGYMVVAAGVSAYAAGIFHLVTHAFYKALLFLCAGSVILAMQHEQNIFNMGNLKKYMPITYACMLIGTLSLIGFPGTSGFYSKDLIIAATRNSNLVTAYFAYWVTLFSVFITTLYACRLNMVVFNNYERMQYSVRSELHESPTVVLAPLILLAIPSIIIGYILMNPVLNNFFQNAIFVLPEHDVILRFAQKDFNGTFDMFWHGFFSWPFLFILSGALLAWLCYMRMPKFPQMLQSKLTILYGILQNKYGFDALNERIIVPLVRQISQICWKVGDILCIDGVLVNGSAKTVGATALLLQKLQTGYLYNYLLIMLAGLVVLLILVLHI